MGRTFCNELDVALFIKYFKGDAINENEMAKYASIQNVPGGMYQTSGECSLR